MLTEGAALINCPDTPVRATDAMVFCGMATTTYSGVGDDLIHKPTTIP